MNWPLPVRDATPFAALCRQAAEEDARIEADQRWAALGAQAKKHDVAVAEMQRAAGATPAVAANPASSGPAAAAAAVAPAAAPAAAAGAPFATGGTTAPAFSFATWQRPAFPPAASPSAFSFSFASAAPAATAGNTAGAPSTGAFSSAFGSALSAYTSPAAPLSLLPDDPHSVDAWTAVLSSGQSARHTIVRTLWGKFDFVTTKNYSLRDVTAHRVLETEEGSGEWDVEISFRINEPGQPLTSHRGVLRVKAERIVSYDDKAYIAD